MNRQTGAHETLGVVLLNLGGPEHLEDVEPFLFNLFSDRMIIRLGPAFLQKPIARFIAKRRGPKSAQAYAKIGGGSPLGPGSITWQLAHLPFDLNRFNPSFSCFVRSAVPAR